MVSNRGRPSRPPTEELASGQGAFVAPVEIADHDPLMGYLLGAAGPIEVDRVDLDSPALREMRALGVHLVVPLISQGDLIGTLNLGKRLSDQPYSSDDRKLLAGLAAQVAPAVRLAQLVQEQEAEAKERERIEQELRVAALIQQTLLPKDLPSPRGWSIDAYYRPARAVGGDFYDFFPMADGRLAIIVGDVTDKGVPAALVMATTRSTLRSAAQRMSDPGKILADANEVLHAEIPPAMFITCIVAILEPATGALSFANAGHNLPYVRTDTGVVELRATGMPLGLMPGMTYDVSTARLAPGEEMLLTSDGIVESHGPDGSMFGFERLMKLVGAVDHGGRLMHAVLEELSRFCGPDHEQEDDVTMVSVRRTSSAEEAAAAFDGTATRSFPSEAGTERQIMEYVADVAARFGMSGAQMERLKTAVSEAAMNAIEHGNGSDPDERVGVSVERTERAVRVRIDDLGAGPDVEAGETPDIEAKLDGVQSPRGWGLYLIDQMVDSVRHDRVGDRHVIEFEIDREGGG